MSAPPNPVTLSLESVGVQHSVAANYKLTGVRPLTSATWSATRNVILTAPPVAANGGGLFVPQEIFDRVTGNPFVTFVQLSSAQNFAWTVAVTSGLDDGDATTKDLVAHDITIATGTGNGLVRAYLELLPNQAIRVTVGDAPAPTAAIYAQVLFAATSGDFGRLIS